MSNGVLHPQAPVNIRELMTMCEVRYDELSCHKRDSFYNFALSAATANLGSTDSLCMNDALPWVLAICFSALSVHSCSNVRFAILPRAAILSIMPKTY